MLMNEWGMGVFWDERGRSHGAGANENKIAFAATLGPVFTRLDLSVFMYRRNSRRLYTRHCGSVIVAVGLRSSLKLLLFRDQHFLLSPP